MLTFCKLYRHFDIYVCMFAHWLVSFKNEIITLNLTGTQNVLIFSEGKRASAEIKNT